MIKKVIEEYFLVILPFIMLPTIRFIPRLFNAMESATNSIISEFFASLIILIIVNAIISAYSIVVFITNIKHRMFKDKDKK